MTSREAVSIMDQDLNQDQAREWAPRLSDRDLAAFLLREIKDAWDPDGWLTEQRKAALEEAAYRLEDQTGREL